MRQSTTDLARATHSPGTNTSLPPAASVVICTRNRGPSICGAVETILANTYPDFELLIIDQSSDDSTERALAPFRDDLRLRYLHTPTQGVGLARNIAIAEAKAEYLIMTDDDCDVPADWVAQMVTALERHPRVAIVFCNVHAGPHDPAQGWILINLTDRDRLISSVPAWCSAGGANAGIGAGMAMRRSYIQKIGGIDAQLGSGSIFRSGWETDATLRALLHGYQIYRTTSVSVQHHGFRTHSEGRNLMRRYMFGIAAVYAKLLKCGHWQILIACLYELWRTVLGPILSSAARLRKPPVLGRATALAQGFIQGLRAPVNRKTQTFQS